jgi:hypothetical protein
MSELTTANQIKDSIDIDIRLGTLDDIQFITSSWLSSTRHIYPNQYNIDFELGFRQHISDLIANSVVLIANLKDEPDEIISYIIYTSFKTNMIIHFAYTKLAARRCNIVSNLIAFANPAQYPIVFTHAPRNENLMIELCNKHIFNPNIMDLL